MKVHDQNGSSIIHLSVFVFLSLLSALLFFVLYGIQSEYEQGIKNNIQRTKAVEKEESDIASSLQQIESLAGFYSVGSRSSLKEMTDATIDSKKLIVNLNKINSKENESGTWKYYGLNLLSNYDMEILEEKLNSMVYFVNLENVIHAFIGRIDELQKELQIVQEDLRIVEIETKDKESQREKITQKQKDILDSLKQKQDGLESQCQARLDAIKDFLEKSKKEKEEAVKKRQDVEKSIQSKKSEFENIISKEKTEIRKLQAAKYGRTAYSEITKQKEFEPSEEKENGNVVFSDPKTQTIYIDIGQDKKAINGLKFDVYRRHQQGKRIFVGRIEVQKVMDKVSMAKVLELKDSFNPIVDGDFIINPVFRENQVVYFAFAGKMTKLSNEQTMKLIEQLGSKVESEVTAKTHFVVVGDRGQDHTNYLSAVTFGIPLITEQILFKYIGD
ncbi:MAG: hypothetical protein HUU50_12945 [Candidatus Brocadiae bacterium]|nr:hypothetical protein [Candidatus Brocadiia bacterium]